MNRLQHSGVATGEGELAFCEAAWPSAVVGLGRTTVDRSHRTPVCLDISLCRVAASWHVGGLASCSVSKHVKRAPLHVALDAALLFRRSHEGCLALRLPNCAVFLKLLWRAVDTLIPMSIKLHHADKACCALSVCAARTPAAASCAAARRQACLEERCRRHTPALLGEFSIVAAVEAYVL